MVGTGPPSVMVGAGGTFVVDSSGAYIIIGPSGFAPPGGATVFVGTPYGGSDTAFVAGDWTTTQTVPEPSTWTLMLLGFAGLGFAGYRSRKAVSVAVIVAVGVNTDGRREGAESA